MKATMNEIEQVNKIMNHIGNALFAVRISAEHLQRALPKEVLKKRLINEFSGEDYGSIEDLILGIYSSVKRINEGREELSELISAPEEYIEEQKAMWEYVAQVRAQMEQEWRNQQFDKFHKASIERILNGNK